MATMPDILDEAHFDDAVRLVRRYFGLAPGSTRHDGASFETIGARWDEESTANEVTPADLVALATLSVEVKGVAAIALLGPELKPQITELLAAIPQTLSLVDPDAARMVDAGSKASELWRLVRTVPGFGPTRASKLLARKRPLLLPIYDSIIRTQLGLKDSRGHWALMRDLVTRDGGALYERAKRIRETAGLDATVTPLRIIDIVLWRHGKDLGLKAEDDA